jgi:hypothetical protein
MARNRKNQSAALRFGPVVKAFLLCLLLGGSGVGYVWQKNQIYQLGLEIKRREMRLVQLHELNKNLSTELGELRRPAYLMRKVKDLNLGLVPAQPSQIWRLDEPLREGPGIQRGPQLAGQTMNSAGLQ